MASDPKGFMYSHVLRPEDLSLSLALLQSTDGSTEGLPYSEQSVFPLDKEQIELLGFELLLLMRPLPHVTDDTTDTKDADATVLKTMNSDDQQKFASKLSAQIMRDMSIDTDNADEGAAALVEMLQLPSPPLDLPPTQHTMKAADEHEEEGLESKLTRAAAISTRWLDERQTVASHALQTLSHQLGLAPASPLPLARQLSRMRRQRSAGVRAVRAGLEDELLEALRLQLGIRRDLAVRLSRLVLLPPPSPERLGQAPSAKEASAMRQLYADVAPFVPYRLMLLQVCDLPTLPRSPQISAVCLRLTTSPPISPFHGLL